ncbi:MAG: CheR family methyltransferase, partial [Erythrobacter sp.]
LLYFDPQTRAKAFDRLASGIAHDGWLMLGAGETVVGQTDKFRPSEFGSSLYSPIIGDAMQFSSRLRAAAS